MDLKEELKRVGIVQKEIVEKSGRPPAFVNCALDVDGVDNVQKIARKMILEKKKQLANEIGR